jgi:hypothetical protein
MSEVSRRSFLRMLGIGAAGAVAAGCAPQILEGNTPVAAKATEKPAEPTVKPTDATKVVEKAADNPLNKLVAQAEETSAPEQTVAQAAEPEGDETERAIKEELTAQAQENQKEIKIEKLEEMNGVIKKIDENHDRFDLVIPAETDLAEGDVLAGEMWLGSGHLVKGIKVSDFLGLSSPDNVRGVSMGFPADGTYASLTGKDVITQMMAIAASNGDKLELTPESKAVLEKVRIHMRRSGQAATVSFVLPNEQAIIKDKNGERLFNPARQLAFVAERDIDVPKGGVRGKLPAVNGNMRFFVYEKGADPIADSRGADKLQKAYVFTEKLSFSEPEVRKIIVQSGK